MKQHIFIIRHGETDYNNRGIIQGREVDTSLNERGKQQAAAFFKEYGNYPFDRIYTSALKRSQQTVEWFIRQGIPWEARPELDEIDWGEQEGMRTTKELRHLYKKVTRAWRQGKLDVKIPGGESPEDLAQRQQQFLRDLHKDPSGHLLICTHGRAMRSLLCLMLGDDLSHMEDYPHANLSLYRILREGNDYRLVVRHDISHLK